MAHRDGQVCSRPAATSNGNSTSALRSAFIAEQIAAVETAGTYAAHDDVHINTLCTDKNMHAWHTEYSDSCDSDEEV